ncbi:hypothetical protein [Cryobacterium breve]|uniref:hypothetical protein n=1 Tax=Cryobacterium breve TaxID=1259258 RepID=UPI00248B8678|nr:hypothetical protein [Cryobacterium breve]
MDVDGDASSVVGDAHGSVGEDLDADRVAVSGEGLVHRVVHNLVDQVVQTSGTGRPDVHTGTLPNGFKSLEDLDIVGAVSMLRLDQWFD